MSAIAFEYRGVDRSGARRDGVLQATSKVEAYRKVQALGLTPMVVRAASERVGASWFGRRGRVRAKDLAHFTYQLGVFVSSQIPLGQGLATIAEQEPAGRFKDIITDIARRIDAGEQLAQAMDAHREALGTVYIQTVRAAERTGNLSKVLEHLSDMLERGQETRQMVRGALMYPACIVGALALALLFLVGFVVPRFAGMFEQRGLDLPAFTRALMLFGTSIQSYFWAYGLGVAGAVYGLRRAWASPRGRLVIDSMLHRVPYLHRILVGLAVGRFSRVLGVSLASGLGLIEALELSAGASGRPKLIADAERMAAKVRNGSRMSDALSDCPYLPGFAKRMLAAGEQSAQLPKMCEVVARHYDRETTHLTKNIGTVIEPVLIVAIAGVVLVVALAIFLPMWDMVKLVG
ncbi:MAG: type II secretion system F family protein [Phycisphaeraceae bacterium]|nr:type II secretion system F family protein [Phycisphaeraceae bacterium]